MAHPFSLLPAIQIFSGLQKLTSDLLTEDFWLFPLLAVVVPEQRLRNWVFLAPPHWICVAFRALSFWISASPFAFSWWGPHQPIHAPLSVRNAMEKFLIHIRLDSLDSTEYFSELRCCLSFSPASSHCVTSRSYVWQWRAFVESNIDEMPGKMRELGMTKLLLCQS